MFGSIYWGEVKKAFRLKTVIIMSIIALVGVIIMAAVFVSMNNQLSEWEEDASVSGPDAYVMDANGGVTYTEESVTEILNELYAERDSVIKQREKEGYSYYRGSDYVYEVESRIAVYEYIRDNKIYNRAVAIYEGSGILGMLGGKMTADNFIVYIASALFTLVMIYGAIVAGSIFADEFKQGTVKLLFMRPISRNQMTTAKLLAALTHVFAAYSIIFLLAVIAGYIAFPVGHVETIFSFNAGAVSVADNTAQIGIAFATGLIKVIAYTVVAFAIGAMSRNKVLAIVTPILIIDIIDIIFRIAGLGRFFITYGADWMKFVGVGSSLIGGSNFFIALAVFIVYMAGLLAGSYLIIDKKDIV